MFSLRITALGRVAGFVAALFVLGACGASDASAGPLRGGVAKVSITVGKPTAPVHDLLYAKALVVDDGQTKAAIISHDVFT